MLNIACKNAFDVIDTVKSKLSSHLAPLRRMRRMSNVIDRDFVVIVTANMLNCVRDVLSQENEIVEIG